MSVVIREAAYIMVHVPDLVRYGSKPSREIAQDPSLLGRIDDHLRSYEEVIEYPPHQVFIGNGSPDDLHAVPKPWYQNLDENATREGPFGEIVPEDEFYAWMKAADAFDLLWLEDRFVDEVRAKFARHRFATEAFVGNLGEGRPASVIRRIVEQGDALPLFFQGKLVGSIRRDHDKDDTLKAHVLLENLMAKASGSLAMLHLFRRAMVDPRDTALVLDCTETAVGDRYNRGGGSLSKAMAEMCGCTSATGNDIRTFCCAPGHATVNAAALVESGVYDPVVVAGGGCLAKVGMKSLAHIKHDMPILEDVIAGIAFLVTRDDGVHPILRLDSIGKHDVGAGSPQQAIMTSLIIKPLNRLGLKMTDIDKYATELHNPEITLPAGSGDTPATNYRIMAALAVLNEEIGKSEMDRFVRERGMPGFCPTQGHVPSAVPFLGHALAAMENGRMNRVMFVAKGSLFLGRMCQLSDGVSFLVERNPGAEE